MKLTKIISFLIQIQLSLVAHKTYLENEIQNHNLDQKI